MFAPYPERDSPRPLISGTLEDGTIVVPYNNTMFAPDLEPYVPTSQHYHNYRWRKFLSNLEDQSYEQGDQILALNYSRYLCRLWNQNHGDKKKLSTVTIKFIVHKTMPPGQQPQRRDNDVWYHDCFDTG